MAEHLIFTIPDMDELVDCFRAPMPDKAFEPDAQGIIHAWPSFHVSQADRTENIANTPTPSASRWKRQRMQRCISV